MREICEQSLLVLLVLVIEANCQTDPDPLTCLSLKVPEVRDTWKWKETTGVLWENSRVESVDDTILHGHEAEAFDVPSEKVSASVEQLRVMHEQRPDSNRYPSPNTHGDAEHYFWGNRMPMQKESLSVICQSWLSEQQSQREQGTHGSDDDTLNSSYSDKSGSPAKLWDFLTNLDIDTYISKYVGGLHGLRTLWQNFQDMLARWSSWDVHELVCLSGFLSISVMFSAVLAKNGGRWLRKGMPQRGNTSTIGVYEDLQARLMGEKKDINGASRSTGDLSRSTMPDTGRKFIPSPAQVVGKAPSRSTISRRRSNDRSRWMYDDVEVTSSDTRKESPDTEELLGSSSMEEEYASEGLVRPDTVGKQARQRTRRVKSGGRVVGSARSSDLFVQRSSSPKTVDRQDFNERVLSQDESQDKFGSRLKNRNALQRTSTTKPHLTDRYTETRPNARRAEEWDMLSDESFSDVKSDATRANIELDTSVPSRESEINALARSSKTQTTSPLPIRASKRSSRDYGERDTTLTTHDRSLQNSYDLDRAFNKYIQSRTHIPKSSSLAVRFSPSTFDRHETTTVRTRDAQNPTRTRDYVSRETDQMGLIEQFFSREADTLSHRGRNAVARAAVISNNRGASDSVAEATNNVTDRRNTSTVHSNKINSDLQDASSTRHAVNTRDRPPSLQASSSSTMDQTGRDDVTAPESTADIHYEQSYHNSRRVPSVNREEPASTQHDPERRSDHEATTRLGISEETQVRHHAENCSICRKEAQIKTDVSSGRRIVGSSSSSSRAAASISTNSRGSHVDLRPASSTVEPSFHSDHQMSSYRDPSTAIASSSSLKSSGITDIGGSNRISGTADRDTDGSSRISKTTDRSFSRSRLLRDTTTVESRS